MLIVVREGNNWYYKFLYSGDVYNVLYVVFFKKIE